MDLLTHIEGPGTIGDIRGYLENLPSAERWTQLQSLDKRHQRTLFLKAEASPPMTLDDLVPPSLGSGEPLPHLGKNSLMLFRNFEKVFARSESGQVFGYNEGRTRPWIGPGYFIARETRGVEEARAAIVVDYFDVPEGPVPAGWPEVVSNARGLQYFVYHKTRDYLRVVAPGICIGSAWKTLFGKERRLNSYFVLMARHTE